MVKTKFKIIIKNDLCKGCDLCITYCKNSVLRSSENLNKQGYHHAEPIEEAECTGCMVCTLVCPEVAIEVYIE